MAFQQHIGAVAEFMAGLRVTYRRADVLSRLLSHTTVVGGCWVWQGNTNSHGYGYIGYQGRNARVHRLAYELLVGALPAGMHVLHRCDNPPCLRPDHLFLGDRSDNQKDSAKKGRHAWQKDPSRATKVRPDLRGSLSPRAKLKDSDVRELKALRKAGWTLKRLSERFGVSLPAVQCVTSGATWAHVE